MKSLDKITDELCLEIFGTTTADVVAEAEMGTPYSVHEDTPSDIALFILGLIEEEQSSILEKIKAKVHIIIHHSSTHAEMRQAIDAITIEKLNN